ncbi:MAG: AtpZ/AtpI family protein [Acidobacteriota bacterium]
MSKLPDDSNRASTEKSRESQSDSLYLIMSMADTTWRMFVPTIGLLLIGNVLDNQWHTKPWLLLAGVAIGGCISALLVKQQLAKGKK